MSWLDRDERNMRRYRPPAQHHEPPVGWTPIADLKRAYAFIDDTQPCGDCGWTPDGWEPCSEHEGEEEPR